MASSGSNLSSNGTSDNDSGMSRMDSALLPFNQDLLSPPSSGSLSFSSLQQIASVEGPIDLPASTARQAVEDAVELGHQRRAVSRIQEDIQRARETLETVQSLEEELASARVKARQSHAHASHLRDRIHALAETLPSPHAGVSLPPLPDPVAPASGKPDSDDRPSTRPSSSHQTEAPEVSQDASPADTRQLDDPEADPNSTSSTPPQENHPSSSGETSSTGSPADAHTPGKSSSSLVYGALYTIAGVVFLAGDVVMSRELVSSAFRLSGTFAPWVFSGALAMLAVLLKPAYTRLVESKYWVGSKRPFFAVISVTLVLSLSCLALLGVYRSQTHANRTQLRHLRQEMQRSSEVDLQSIRSQIARIQQETAQSPYGRASFALVTVLFAVAGAIALGIGVRHLRGFYHWRLRPWWTEKSRRRRLVALQNEYTEALEDVSTHRETLARLRSRLDTHSSASTLRERISDLRSDRQDTLQTLQLIEQSFANEVFEMAGHHSMHASSPDDASPPSNGQA